jgi:hypothetical protein
MANRIRREDGVALVMVLVANTLLLALGGALVTLTMTEARIVTHYRDSMEVFFAADGVVEHVVSGMRTVIDVDALLNGSIASAFVDGAPEGTRTVGNAILELDALTNVERCGSTARCDEVAMDAITEERPSGRNNPRWQLYAHGSWGDLIETAPGGPQVYVVAWVADDPAENDSDPLRDGAEGAPGHGAIALRVHAYGARGERRVIDAVITGVPGSPRVTAWTERR